MPEENNVISIKEHLDAKFKIDNAVDDFRKSLVEGQKMVDIEMARFVKALIGRSVKLYGVEGIDVFIFALSKVHTQILDEYFNGQPDDIRKNIEAAFMAYVNSSRRKV